MEIEKLFNIISEVTSVDVSTIDTDTKFVDDLNLDSLDLVQIIMTIEEEYDIEISDEDAEKILTVGDAVEAIKAQINS